MTRDRDIQRRFLQRNGWRAVYSRRTGEWNWRNARVAKGTFSRLEATELQLRQNRNTNSRSRVTAR